MRRATTASSSSPFDALVLRVSAWQCNRCGKLHVKKEWALICCKPCSVFKEPFGKRGMKRNREFCDSHFPGNSCSTCGFTAKAEDLWWRKYRRAYAKQKAGKAHARHGPRGEHPRALRIHEVDEG